MDLRLDNRHWDFSQLFSNEFSLNFHSLILCILDAFKQSLKNIHRLVYELALAPSSNVTAFRLLLSLEGLNIPGGYTNYPIAVTSQLYLI